MKSKSQKIKKLNLGSGAFKKKDFVNIDIEPNFKPDVLHDLNKLPYPFKQNSFDLIEADHVIEHLEQPLKVVLELHRILKNDGILVMRVPHFSRGFTHSDHKRGFDVSFLFYFNPKFKPGFMGKQFLLQKMRLNWFAQPYMKAYVMPKSLIIVGMGLGWVINFFANLNPFICSRIWCYWVGGFEEIEFILKKYEE